jgi:hypothetical protein
VLAAIDPEFTAHGLSDITYVTAGKRLRGQQQVDHSEEFASDWNVDLHRHRHWKGPKHSSRRHRHSQSVAGCGRRGAGTQPGDTGDGRHWGCLVLNCYIDGKVMTDPGDLDGDGVAVTPVKILPTGKAVSCLSSKSFSVRRVQRNCWLRLVGVLKEEKVRDIENDINDIEAKLRH